MKNLTKSLSYFLFFLMLGVVACKKSDSAEPISIVGKWKITAITFTPMPSNLTQKDVDSYVECFRNVVYEYTATKAIITGKDCYGNSYNEQGDYTISGSTVTDKSTGDVIEVSVNGNTFSASSYDKTDKTTTKVTYTRL